MCTQLQTLDLSWCAKLTDLCINQLALNCRRLQTLNCSNCGLLSGKGLEELAEHCTQLSSLILKGCKKLEHITLKSKSLELLNLANCERLSPESIARIRCPNLRVLELTSCKRITGNFPIPPPLPGQSQGVLPRFLPPLSSPHHNLHSLPL